VIQFPGVRPEVLTQQLTSNTKFFRLHVPREYADRDVELHFFFRVALQEPARIGGRDAWFLLDDIRATIRDEVIPRLAPFCAQAIPDGFPAATAVPRPLPLRWVDAPSSGSR
jgi:hypothetical protein